MASLSAMPVCAVIVPASLATAARTESNGIRDKACANEVSVALREPNRCPRS